MENYFSILGTLPSLPSPPLPSLSFSYDLRPETKEFGFGLNVECGRHYRDIMVSTRVGVESSVFETWLQHFEEA